MTQLLMPEAKEDERGIRVLERIASILKLAIIVTVYFSICAIIIMAIIGTSP